LPASLFEELNHIQPVPEMDPPSGTLFAAVALSLAAVLAGFRIAGKKIPVPRLAAGTGLTLLVLFAFGGCGGGQRVTDVSTRPCAPLTYHQNQSLEGEVLLERGKDENAGWLIVPVTEAKKLPTP
jgi:hypothetical protein